PASGHTTQVMERWELAGTPSYMAPEVILSNDFDERADLFSLGIVFYEMLTGSNPFHGDGKDVTCNRIIHETPPPISERNPHVDSRLEQIVFKLLAKDPGRRFAGAEELLGRLNAVVKQPAKRFASVELLAGIFDRHRVTKIALALVVV